MNQKYLLLKIKILKECLNYFLNFRPKIQSVDILLNDNYYINSKGEKYKVPDELAKLLESMIEKPRIKYNDLNKKVLAFNSSIDLIENILQNIENGHHVIVYNKNRFFSTEVILENITYQHNLDGSLIKTSDEICTNLNIKDQNLSNYNSEQKQIVIIRNYQKMLQNMTVKEQTEWLCHLRNSMENKNPILFVLLDVNDMEDNTFLINNELIGRLNIVYN